MIKDTTSPAIPPQAAEEHKLRQVRALYKNSFDIRRIIDSFAKVAPDQREIEVATIYAHGLFADEAEVRKYLRRLQEYEWGWLLLGRRGQPTRFRGSTKLRNIYECASGNADSGATSAHGASATLVLQNGAPSSAKVMNSSEPLIEHLFHLRPNLAVRFSLPENLTKIEATRIAGFIQALPF